MSLEEAHGIGAKAGVVSPRLADCGEHCAKMLGDVKEPMTVALESAFTAGCRAACEKQMTEGRERDRQAGSR